jgi:hypothetical protein
LTPLVVFSSRSHSIASTWPPWSESSTAAVIVVFPLICGRVAVRSTVGELEAGELTSTAPM